MAQCAPTGGRQRRVSRYYQHRFSEATRVWRNGDIVGAKQAGECVSSAGVKGWSDLGDALYVQSHGSVAICAGSRKRETGVGPGPPEYRLFAAVQGLSLHAGE